MNQAVAKALFDEEAVRLDERLLNSRGWVLHGKTYPVMDVSFRSPDRQELRLQLKFDDWNDSPPSVALLSKEGDVLTSLPKQKPGTGSNIFNASPHPRTGRPFVCMAGIREYHEHPSHVGESWNGHKTLENFTFGAILMKLWRGWEKYWP